MVTELLRFYDTFHRRVYNFEAPDPRRARRRAFSTRISSGPEAKRRDRHRVGALPRRAVVDLWQRTDREPNAHVGVEVDSDGFLELLVERINSFE
jgi:hypothetical protein